MSESYCLQGTRRRVLSRPVLGIPLSLLATAVLIGCGGGSSGGGGSSSGNGDPADTQTGVTQSEIEARPLAFSHADSEIVAIMQSEAGGPHMVVFQDPQTGLLDRIEFVHGDGTRSHALLDENARIVELEIDDERWQFHDHSDTGMYVTWYPATGGSATTFVVNFDEIDEDGEYVHPDTATALASASVRPVRWSDEDSVERLDRQIDESVEIFTDPFETYGPLWLYREAGELIAGIVGDTVDSGRNLVQRLRDNADRLGNSLRCALPVTRCAEEAVAGANAFVDTMDAVDPDRETTGGFEVTTSGMEPVAEDWEDESEQDLLRGAFESQGSNCEEFLFADQLDECAGDDGEDEESDPAAGEPDDGAEEGGDDSADDGTGGDAGDGQGGSDDGGADGSDDEGDTPGGTLQRDDLPTDIDMTAFTDLGTCELKPQGTTDQVYGIECDREWTGLYWAVKAEGWLQWDATTGEWYILELTVNEDPTCNTLYGGRCYLLHREWTQRSYGTFPARARFRVRDWDIGSGTYTIGTEYQWWLRGGDWMPTFETPHDHSGRKDGIEYRCWIDGYYRQEFVAGDAVGDPVELDECAIDPDDAEAYFAPWAEQPDLGVAYPPAP